MSQIPDAPLKEALALRVGDQHLVADSLDAEDSPSREESHPASSQRPTEVLTPAVRRVLEWHLRESLRH